MVDTVTPPPRIPPLNLDDVAPAVLAYMEQVDRWLRELARIVNTKGTGGGGGGAPTTAQYLVSTSDATLSAERVATNTGSITWDFATAAQAKANVQTQMSLTSDASGIKLSGDSASPGNDKYYGTNGVGTKGFHSIPAGGGGITHPQVLARTLGA